MNQQLLMQQQMMQMQQMAQQQMMMQGMPQFAGADGAEAAQQQQQGVDLDGSDHGRLTVNHEVNRFHHNTSHAA